MIDETELPDYIAAYQEALARWQLNQRTLRIGFDHQNLPAPAIIQSLKDAELLKKPEQWRRQSWNCARSNNYE